MKTSNKILCGVFSCIFVALLMAAIAARISSCSAFTFFGHRIVGNGNIVTQTRSLPNFNAVGIAVMGKVIVKKGNKFQIVMQNDQNIIPYIETNVEDGVLHIKAKNRASLSPSGKPVFIITTNNMKSFSASGTNKVFISNINKQQFKLDFSGSGRCHFSGTTKDLKIDLSGTNKVFGKNIVADSTKIDMSGMGSCELAGKTKSLYIDMSGTGKVVAPDFVADDITVDMSGTGQLILHALKSLNTSISGTGHIQYYGNPTQISQRVSGTGKIEKMGQSRESSNMVHADVCRYKISAIQSSRAAQ